MRCWILGVRWDQGGVAYGSINLFDAQINEGQCQQ